MNRSTLAWVKRVNEEYGIRPTAVLEVGSRDYNGTPRNLFCDSAYVGVDIRAGSGVDLVMSAYELATRFSPACFDAVLALNVLEHLGKLWRALAEMRKVLAPGGHLYVSMPAFGYPRHDYPGDFWRASEQAVREVIMSGFEILSLEHSCTQWGKYPLIHCLGMRGT